MTWPANKQTLVQAFTAANRAAIRAKSNTQTISNASAAGSINRDRLIDLQNQLNEAIVLWTQVKALSGIVAYAQDQFDDPALDVAAEFTAMVDAAVDLRDWIFNNFPTNSGAALIKSLNISGTLTTLEFTTAQLSGFRTEADTFIATIG